MSDIPELRFRDMAARLEAIGKTHQQIATGIRERAAQEESFRHERDTELNTNHKLGYRAAK